MMLLPYQVAWIEDKSRFKAGMWARQTGKTFTATLEICLSCLEKPEFWLILSRGERQAKEAIETGVKRHFYNISCLFEEFYTDETSLEVRLPNGSRIMAVPANPDTVRGFSGNVLLDEFAFHNDSKKIWQAIFPTISAGFKIRVLSTPNGKGNKFYEIMTNGDKIWSRHIVDIYDAVKAGLPRDLKEMRAALNDDDAWAQEYELKWLDEAHSWLDYDLIYSCESSDAGKPYLYSNGPCYIGWDVARRRDLSIIWVIECAGGFYWTREIVALKRAHFTEQLEAFGDLMKRFRVVRVCVDQTGMGEFLTDHLQSRYGSCVQGVLFTPAKKLDLAVLVKRCFQDGRVWVPVDPAVRESLHSIKRMSGSGGNVRFDADHDEGGHGDYFWALALALHGAVEGAVEFSQMYPTNHKIMGDGVRFVQSSDYGWGVVRWSC